MHSVRLTHRTAAGKSRNESVLGVASPLEGLIIFVFLSHGLSQKLFIVDRLWKQRGGTVRALGGALFFPFAFFGVTLAGLKPLI